MYKHKMMKLSAVGYDLFPPHKELHKPITNCKILCFVVVGYSYFSPQINESCQASNNCRLTFVPGF